MPVLMRIELLVIFIGGLSLIAFGVWVARDARAGRGPSQSSQSSQSSHQPRLFQCVYLAHENWAPSWGCCQCHTSNGMQRVTCRTCDHRCCLSLQKPRTVLPN